MADLVNERKVDVVAGRDEPILVIAAIGALCPFKAVRNSPEIRRAERTLLAFLSIRLMETRKTDSTRSLEGGSRYLHTRPVYFPKRFAMVSLRLPSPRSTNSSVRYTNTFGTVIRLRGHVMPTHRRPSCRVRRCYRSDGNPMATQMAISKLRSFSNRVSRRRTSSRRERFVPNVYE